MEIGTGQDVLKRGAAAVNVQRRGEDMRCFWDVKNVKFIYVQIMTALSVTILYYGNNNELKPQISNCDVNK